jgi:pimeloyl-ACP methyl ester carboxylesterase
LIHGAGDSAWYWHLVSAELRAHGHDVVAVDLPCDDDSAGLSEYTDVVVHGIGDRPDLIVVAQSFGGYTAPLVCARRRVDLLVFVAGMIPAPGESARDMFSNTGYVQPKHDDASELAVFYHDVPPELAAEALSKGRNQSETPWREPWPLSGWPNVPTRYVMCRNDRVFPAAWTRRVVRDRLGIAPNKIDSGHCPALSRPKELANLLEAWSASAGSGRGHGRQRSSHAR